MLSRDTPKEFTKDEKRDMRHSIVHELRRRDIDADYELLKKLMEAGLEKIRAMPTSFYNAAREIVEDEFGRIE